MDGSGAGVDECLLGIEPLPAQEALVLADGAKWRFNDPHHPVIVPLVAARAGDWFAGWVDRARALASDHAAISS